MRRRFALAFTLVELLTVIAVILIVASMVVSLAKPAFLGSAKKRTMAEIQHVAAACESYKSDFGGYPRREGITEPASDGTAPLDPRKDGNPDSAAYHAASKFLYQELSGDKDLDGKLNSATEPRKSYLRFDAIQLAGTKDAKGNLQQVQYIKDPFGFCYGYSTAAARSEEDFRAQSAAAGNQAKRPAESPGYNTTFDLWSTGGKSTTAGKLTDADRAVWIKNW